MARRALMGMCSIAMILTVATGLSSPAGAAPAPIELLVPQQTAFTALHYNCGGIKESVYANGLDTSLDPSAGYPTGDALLSTTCNGSGKGGHSTTYTAWVSATWDPSGALVTSSVLTSAPTFDPSFSATDTPSQNVLYNTTNFNCSSQAGAVPSACLQWSGGFTARPRLLGLAPSIGASKGGATVTISGDALISASEVYFGSVPAASFSVVNDSTITATTPAALPGTVDVTVVSPGGTSTTSSVDTYTAYGQPTITRLWPDRGPVTGGYWVTLTGTHLVGTTSVTAGDSVTAFQTVSDSTLRVYIPPSDSGPGDGMSLKVTSPGGSSPSSAAAQFTYSAAASIATAPSRAVPGALIRATGADYFNGEKVTVVYKTGKSSPSSVTICTAITSANGTFSCKGRIPAKAKAGVRGSHQIVATGTLGDSSSAVFHLT